MPFIFSITSSTYTLAHQNQHTTHWHIRTHAHKQSQSHTHPQSTQSTTARSHGMGGNHRAADEGSHVRQPDDRRVRLGSAKGTLYERHGGSAAANRLPHKPNPPNLTHLTRVNHLFAAFSTTPPGSKHQARRRVAVVGAVRHQHPTFLLLQRLVAVDRLASARQLRHHPAGQAADAQAEHRSVRSGRC